MSNRFIVYNLEIFRKARTLCVGNKKHAKESPQRWHIRYLHHTMHPF